MCNLPTKFHKTNVFEHASIPCAATFEIREAWWNTVVDNFEIKL